MGTSKNLGSVVFQMAGGILLDASSYAFFYLVLAALSAAAMAIAALARSVPYEEILLLLLLPALTCFLTVVRGEKK